MENFEELKNKFSHINGWGVDADPENEPTYPLKRYTGDDHDRLGWERPELQKSDAEILKSNERPYLTAAYGTPNPPVALSGVIRRRAFKYSESSYAHWLPLILADRVNVVEGIIDDIRKGHFPNIFKEKGWAAEWKHRPRKLVGRFIIGIVVTSLLVSAMKRKR
jgi:hypothetical protein